MSLRPFFSYFGGKWTLATRYPRPIHSVIVEPFAGSAGYATRYPDRDIVLVERSPVVAELWRWLIGASVDDVLGLPLDATKRFDLAPGPQALIGFWSARGRTRPPTAKSTSSWAASGKWPSSFWGEYARARIARQIPAIRHWRVIEGDYTSAPDVEATWFIDPPYIDSRHYTAKVDGFTDLGAWCRSRRGQVMVCEQDGADWLPFVPFRKAKSIARGSYGETIWTPDQAEETSAPVKRERTR